MADFIKIKHGLIFSLVALLLGLPFFHYHPDNSHAHQSALSEHHHEGHYHSNELSGFVGLINQGSTPLQQGEEHHPHSDTDTGANYFEVSLQKSGINLLKTLKSFKSGNTQKPILIAEPAFSHPLPIGLQARESSDSAHAPKERSPPFPFV
jgi:hypothetical protein